MGSVVKVRQRGLEGGQRAGEESVKNKAPGTQCLESEPQGGVALVSETAVTQISLQSNCESTEVTDGVIRASIVRTECQEARMTGRSETATGMTQT